jgi:hypothetical protein
MNKCILFLAVGVLMLSILACGSSTDATVQALTIVNNTQNITICNLYISPTGNSDWGENKLAGAQIAPGETFNIDVEPGTYDLKVSDCDSANEVTREAQDLSGSFTWTLGQEASVPALEVVNATQGITFCYLYISPAGSGDWGEDKLQGTQIEPGKSFTIDVDGGAYDLKVEDCNHGSTAIQNAMEINSLVRWTLNENASGSADGKVTLRVQNDTAVSFCYLYVAGSDSSIPWGDDILRGTQIGPGGTFDVMLEPGFYKIKAIDCGQTGQVINENQDVTKSVLWSIK